jgi:hypothetical protein
MVSGTAVYPPDGIADSSVLMAFDRFDTIRVNERYDAKAGQSC